MPGSPLTDRYEPLIVGRPAFVSFQTVAELHFGALRRGWGPARMLHAPLVVGAFVSIPNRHRRSSELAGR